MKPPNIQGPFVSPSSPGVVPPRRSRLGMAIAAGLVVGAMSGCAHTETVEPKVAQENEVLRERVRHLERRVSDLDAQLTMLSDKLDSDGADAPIPRQRPLDRTRATDLVPSRPAEITHEGDRVEKIGLGTESIDLDPRARPLSSRVQSRGPITQSELWSAPDPRDAPLSDAETIAALEAERDLDTPAPARDGPPSEGVQAIYDWALSRLNRGEYLPAIAAFEDVLERYPEHHLADNALYWTAVAHARRGEGRLAIEVFQSLPMRFPSSPKLADALFEMGLAYEALGETKLAQSFYAQMISQYPRAERKADAQRALSRLR